MLKIIKNFIKRNLAIFLHDEIDKITMKEIIELQRARRNN